MKILVEFYHSRPNSPARVRLLREAPSPVDPFANTPKASSSSLERALASVDRQQAEKKAKASVPQNGAALSPHQIEMALRDGLRKGRGTNTGYAVFKGAQGVDGFVKVALPHLVKAVGKAKEFRFLGSGAIGIAFSLGDKVLKLEVDDEDLYSSKHKLGAGGDLQRKGEPVGADIPMVYDKGSFDYEDFTFSWYVIEKFETLEGGMNPRVERGVQRIVTEIANLVGRLATSSAVDEKEIRSGMESIRARHEAGAARAHSSYAPIAEIESTLRLGTDWMFKLAKAMIRREAAGIPGDFHVGNLGIRRSGGEGYVVFFD